MFALVCGRPGSTPRWFWLPAAGMPQCRLIASAPNVRNRTLSVELLRQNVRYVYANLVNCDCFVSCVEYTLSHNLGLVICGSRASRIAGGKWNDRFAISGSSCARLFRPRHFDGPRNVFWPTLRKPTNNLVIFPSCKSRCAGFDSFKKAPIASGPTTKGRHAYRLRCGERRGASHEV